MEERRPTGAHEKHVKKNSTWKKIAGKLSGKPETANQNSPRQPSHQGNPPHEETRTHGPDLGPLQRVGTDKPIGNLSRSHIENGGYHTAEDVIGKIIAQYRQKKSDGDIVQADTIGPADPEDPDDGTPPENGGKPTGELDALSEREYRRAIDLLNDFSSQSGIIFGPEATGTFTAYPPIPGADQTDEELTAWSYANLNTTGTDFLPEYRAGSLYEARRERDGDIGGWGITDRSTAQIRERIPAIDREIEMAARKEGKIVILGNGFSPLATELADRHAAGELQERPVIVDLFDYRAAQADFIALQQLFSGEGLEFPYTQQLAYVTGIVEAIDTENLTAVQYKIGTGEAPSEITDAALVISSFGPDENTMQEQVSLLQPGGKLLATGISFEDVALETGFSMDQEQRIISRDAEASREESEKGDDHQIAHVAPEQQTAAQTGTDHSKEKTAAPAPLDRTQSGKEVAGVEPVVTSPDPMQEDPQALPGTPGTQQDEGGKIWKQPETVQGELPTQAPKQADETPEKQALQSTPATPQVVYTLDKLEDQHEPESHPDTRVTVPETKPVEQSDPTRAEIPAPPAPAPAIEPVAPKKDKQPEVHQEALAPATVPEDVDHPTQEAPAAQQDPEPNLTKQADEAAQAFRALETSGDAGHDRAELPETSGHESSEKDHDISTSHDVSPEKDTF